MAAAPSDGNLMCRYCPMRQAQTLVLQRSPTTQYVGCYMPLRVDAHTAADSGHELARTVPAWSGMEWSGKTCAFVTGWLRSAHGAHYAHLMRAASAPISNLVTVRPICVKTR